MLQSTEILIKHISEEITGFDQEFLICYNPKNDKPIIYNKLGSEIVENYPWPVGVELRRLFTVKEPGHYLIKQILRTFEKTVQYISFIMLSQVIEERLKNTLLIPEQFSIEFKKRFIKLSTGDFVWLMKSLVNIFKKQDKEWFMNEMSLNFNEKFFEDLNFLVHHRNEYVHNRTSTILADIEKLSIVLSEYLRNVLVKVAFLVRYKLVYIREIKVFKSKYRDAKFHHNMDLLNISHLNFPVEEFDVPKKYTDTNAVLLMKSTHAIEEYLNLSPLIIDVNSELFKDSTQPNIPEDIYMYSQLTNGHITYTGTETSGICTTSSEHFSNLLEEEFNEIMVLIS